MRLVGGPGDGRDYDVPAECVKVAFPTWSALAIYVITGDRQAAIFHPEDATAEPTAGPLTESHR